VDGGTLVLSTSNRLGRVVDRIRKLTTEAESLPDESRKISQIIGQIEFSRLRRKICHLYGSSGAKKIPTPSKASNPAPMTSTTTRFTRYVLGRVEGTAKIGKAKMVLPNEEEREAERAQFGRC
jgi:hypothetical protein